MVGIIYKRQDGKKKEEGLLVCSCEQTYLFIFLIYLHLLGWLLNEKRQEGTSTESNESKYGDQANEEWDGDQVNEEWEKGGMMIEKNKSKI